MSKELWEYQKEFNEWLNNNEVFSFYGLTMIERIGIIDIMEDTWDAAIEFMESRGCDTCKHSPRDIYKEKCKYCKHVDNNEDNWSQKNETRK